MKHGAYHYANKPFNLDEIAIIVEKALETTRLRREARRCAPTRRSPSFRPYRGWKPRAGVHQGADAQGRDEPGVHGAAER